MSAAPHANPEGPTDGSAPDPALHVVLGTGPVGCWVARTLVARGLPVRAVNRSGRRPDLLPAEVALERADVSDPAQATAAARDAAVLYVAVNPPYHRWHELFPALQDGALAAARAHGARYVSVENLYMYDSREPMVESTRIAPASKKGELRRRMAEGVMAAHAAGLVQATALRAADYYGPGVTESAWGERVFGPLVAGKRAQVTGVLDAPHSIAYIEDVGRALVELGTREEALGEAWIAPHAPARTQGELVAAAAAHVPGADARPSAMGPFMLRLGGLFIPAAREMVEMMDQFMRPFVADGSRFERTFGVEPTPLDVGLARTVAWYKTRSGGGASA